MKTRGAEAAPLWLMVVEAAEIKGKWGEACIAGQTRNPLTFLFRYRRASPWKTQMIKAVMSIASGAAADNSIDGEKITGIRRRKNVASTTYCLAAGAIRRSNHVMAFKMQLPPASAAHVVVVMECPYRLLFVVSKSTPFIACLSKLRRPRMRNGRQNTEAEGYRALRPKLAKGEPQPAAFLRLAKMEFPTAATGVTVTVALRCHNAKVS